MNGYLMINEITDEDGKKHSQLWYWKGEIDQKPQPIDLLEMNIFEYVEAVAPVTVNGEARLLFLSDDGKVKKKKPAHYSSGM